MIGPSLDFESNWTSSWTIFSVIREFLYRTGSASIFRLMKWYVNSSFYLCPGTDYESGRSQNIDSCKWAMSPRLTGACEKTFFGATLISSDHQDLIALWSRPRINLSLHASSSCLLSAQSTEPNFHWHLYILMTSELVFAEGMMWSWGYGVWEPNLECPPNSFSYSQSSEVLPSSMILKPQETTSSSILSTRICFFKSSLYKMAWSFENFAIRLLSPSNAALYAVSPGLTTSRRWPSFPAGTHLLVLINWPTTSCIGSFSFMAVPDSYLLEVCKPALKTQACFFMFVRYLSLKNFLRHWSLIYLHLSHLSPWYSCLTFAICIPDIAHLFPSNTLPTYTLPFSVLAPQTFAIYRTVQMIDFLHYPGSK